LSKNSYLLAPGFFGRKRMQRYNFSTNTENFSGTFFKEKKIFSRFVTKLAFSSSFSSIFETNGAIEKLQRMRILEFSFARTL
ncbi:MAG: hypothetical protein J5552_04500, partial [Prevotella sp.]|nr:hypothetical protein [Prevotella sp.]